MSPVAESGVTLAALLIEFGFCCPFLRRADSSAIEVIEFGLDSKLRVKRSSFLRCCVRFSCCVRPRRWPLPRQAFNHASCSFQRSAARGDGMPERHKRAPNAKVRSGLIRSSHKTASQPGSRGCCAGWGNNFPPRRKTANRARRNGKDRMAPRRKCCLGVSDCRSVAGCVVRQRFLQTTQHTDKRTDEHTDKHTYGHSFAIGSRKFCFRML